MHSDSEGTIPASDGLDHNKASLHGMKI